jgi:hypothetical protein
MKNGINVQERYDQTVFSVVRNARFLLVLNVFFLLPALASAQQVPTIVVLGPSNILSTSMNINATVNPNGLATTLYLQFGTSTSYGQIGTNGRLDPGDQPVPIFGLMTGLTPNTLYHYQWVATNSAGISLSPDMTVTSGTGSATPGLSLISATDISSTGATVNATVDPKNSPTGFYVLWGTTAAYDHNGRAVPVSSQSSPVPVSTTLSDLAPNTTYHYQCVATNSAGRSFSADMTFTTLDGTPPPPHAPVATTSWSWSITGTGAAIDGIVEPNGSDTTCFFHWGTTTAYGNTTPVSVATANYVQTFTTAWLTDLSPGTTYHYQFVATNINGVSMGDDATFTTLSGVYIGDHLFVYTTNNGTITISSYNGPGGVVPIPDQITGMPVTSIGTSAFSGSSVTSVIIPNTVTSIESSAFAGSGLTNLVIPGSVSNIAEQAFSFCSSLTDVTIENGVVTLGPQAFGWCSQLANITIPDSVTTIEDGLLSKGGPAGLFALCQNLTNVTVGTGLSYLGTGAFFVCPNLVSVLFRGNAPVEGQFWAIDHTAFTGDGSATVYYLPGTTGWGDTYAGRPAMLWNGQAQGPDTSPNMRPEGFAFAVRGLANTTVLIEATTDLTAPYWVPVQTCTLTNGVFHFLDLESSNYPARFYRVRSP